MIGKLLILCAATATVAISGCGPSTLPCGTFTFTGAPHASRGIDMTLNFDFDPACPTQKFELV